jgi:site-specific DNA-methyltransferase (adenine-specific)
MLLDPKYLSFIIQARWYVGGMGLGEFRSSMLSDRRIRVLVDFPNAAEVFPGVQIKGGVCYFLWDRDYDGMCEVSNVMSGETVMTIDRVLDAEDVFVRFNQAISILEKVRVRNEETMVDQVSSGVPFGVRTNFSDFEDEPFTDAVVLYARGRIGYVEEEKLSTNRDWIPEWKVLIPNAGDGSAMFPIVVLGRPIVAPPGSACTQTYLVAGVFDTEAEAENLAAYMRTRFFRYLVSLRKTTQHASQGVYAFVPKLDMRHRWTDQELYERYDLDAVEVEEIESKIKEMLS